MQRKPELEHTVLHPNLLVRLFSRLKMAIAVRLAGLRKEDLILDFGCGAGWLKENLKKKGYRAAGYDIIQETSDVIDYTVLRPDKIFVLDVFEHMPADEIRRHIRAFKRMRPGFELIAGIPTENWLSRKARKLLGKTERAQGHITPLKDILAILSSEMKQVGKFNFLTVSLIAKFRDVPA